MYEDIDSDDNGAEDELTVIKTKPTWGSVAKSAAEIDLIDMTPNPRFDNYKEIFDDLLLIQNVNTIYPIISMIINNIGIFIY